MKLRNPALTLGLAAGLAAGLLLFASGARAGDDKPPAPPAAPADMPAVAKPIDCPLAKALVGTWAVAQKSDFGDATGTVKFALGVGGSALIEDYEVSMGPMGTFHGHGVSRPSDDGKSLQLWWYDNMHLTMELYEGSLTDKGFDLKSSKGVRLTLAQTPKGFEFKLIQPDGSFFTDTYTKK